MGYKPTVQLPLIPGTETGDYCEIGKDREQLGPHFGPDRVWRVIEKDESGMKLEFVRDKQNPDFVLRNGWKVFTRKSWKVPKNASR